MLGVAAWLASLLLQICPDCRKINSEIDLSSQAAAMLLQVCTHGAEELQFVLRISSNGRILQSVDRYRQNIT
jgi:hypothetical protein